MAADTSLWSSEAWSSAADLHLLARSREGSAEAFGELWRRHLPAAYAVANRHKSRRASAEDVVAEASARVFALIKEGRGPDEHFRSYFLSAVRTVAVDGARHDLRVVPTEDDDLEDLVEPVVEQPETPFDADLVRTAFRGLSERDQRVLWHTTVEGATPRALAPTLGMSANAVSVRAMRARESLRALYLDACADRGAAGADSDECRWVIAHLGAHVRGRLPKRQAQRAESHLADCPHAAALAADLKVIHDGFPALIVPLVLAAGLGTSGFVSGAAVGGIVTGATLGGPSTPAPAGGSGGSGDAGLSGSSSLASTPSAAFDVLAQVAARATSLVAGVAIGAGVAGAAALPSEPSAPLRAVAPRAATPTATPTATPSAPGSSAPARPGPAALPGSVAAPPPAPSPAPGRPGATSGGSRVLASPPAADRASGSASAPSRGRPSSTPSGDAPAPPASSPGQTPEPTPKPTPTPRPSPSPTPDPETRPGRPASIVVRVISDGDSVRFSLRVTPGADGKVTVWVSNSAGHGRLVVRNSAFRCVPTSLASVRCSGSDGRAQLEQSGLEAPSPVTVRVRDAAGTETVRTLSLG